MNQSPDSNLPLCAQLVNDLISHSTFSSIVRTHNSDRNAKKFNSWNHLVWMTLSHIAGCRGIRDIAGLMSSLQGSINHLGGRQAPSKSTIAYQNQHRRWEVFRDAYYAIRKSLGQQLKQGYTTSRKFTDASSFWIPPPSPSRSIPFPGLHINTKREESNCTPYWILNRQPRILCILRTVTYWIVLLPTR